MERAIIGRVKGLFDSRDITQRELADALGVSPSWVSAFFGGKRPANDIHLLLKIARYFGVTVGYLLNETERGRDAGASTLLAVWEGLGDQHDRDTFLKLALLWKGRNVAPDTEPSPELHPARGSGADTKSAPRKRR